MKSGVHMIPESLTVLQLQEKRYELQRAIEELMRRFVAETGCCVRIDPCVGSPQFTSGKIDLDIAVSCGLTDGLELARNRPPGEI